jgi:hypothetical protein
MKRKTTAPKQLKNKPAATTLAKMFFHENTPPPLLVEDGSLNISAVIPLAPGGSQNVWSYSGTIPGSQSSEIAHIKVLHGSGNVVFMDLDAGDSTITINLLDEVKGAAGKLEITGGPNQFQIISTGQGNGTGKLDHTPPTGTASATPKHRYTHKGGENAKAFRVVGINITKPSGQVFNLRLPLPTVANPFVSQEFRILVWFAD